MKRVDLQVVTQNRISTLANFLLIWRTRFRKKAQCDRVLERKRASFFFHVIVAEAHSVSKAMFTKAFCLLEQKDYKVGHSN